MKKMITSAGLVVLGAAGVQAQYAPAPDLGRLQTTKPWSVSASLRGFYDDNYVTRPSRSATGLEKRDSYGIELSPSVGFNWTLPQTYIGLSYLYNLRWYEDRRAHEADHAHQATVKVSHAFTERYKLDVSDSFVSAQEPEVIDPGTSRRLRTDGDNIRNTASATFTAGLTENLSTVLGYSNTFYDYDQEGVGSLSALLDRMEHLGMVNLRWQAQPSTVGILGYQYGITEYDEDNVLGSVFVLTPAGLALRNVGSDSRDSRSHYVYVGVDQSFSPELNGSVRVGAQFTEYENVDEDTISPYADGNLTYTYNPGSYVQLGVRHTRQATDIAFFDLTTPTLDQEATTIYGSVNHKISSKLTGSLLAQFQHATFESGAVDGDTENFFLAGVNVAYAINEFLSAETGYNFDRLDSDVADRSFTRNRIYIGIRATY
jgi:hypothetical protein